MTQINLDQLDIDCSGEGLLGGPARAASRLAEKILREQLKSHQATVHIDGVSVGVLGHLAQLEAWTGLKLFRRKFSQETKGALKEGYALARRQVSELGPLSPSSWRSFVEAPGTALDLDFLKTRFDVTIVVPCCRPRAFLERFVSEARKWAPYVREILIVSDGNSPEENAALTRALSSLENARVLERDKNLGPGVARNFGIEGATGQFVGFLDFDDTFDEQMLPLFLKSLVSGGASLMSSHLLKEPKNHLFFARRFCFPDLLFKNQVAVNLFFERNLFTQLRLEGPFNPLLQNHFEDWELNIALRLKGEKPTLVGLPVYKYLIHEQGRQLSAVTTHWKSRLQLARVCSRVNLSPRRAQAVLYLQNVLIQKMAQKEHAAFAEGLFVQRGMLVLQKLYRFISRLPLGQQCLRFLSKLFSL